MFPNSEHTPAAPAEFASYQAIPCAVARELGVPKGSVGLGPGVAAWAAVTEAAVHEQCDSRLPEHEVRLAENGLVPTPAGDPMRSENPDESEFRLLVATPPDVRHDLRTLSLGEKVRHPCKLSQGGGEHLHEVADLFRTKTWAHAELFPCQHGV